MAHSLSWPHAGKITAMESAKKENLRQTLREARPHSSLGLTENLIRLTLELNAQTIASYWPLASEPDVSGFNQWVELLGKQLITPRIQGESLEFATGETALSSIGIREPQGEVVPLSQADLIFVPALAVDRFGNRLGKGKGFYDRALVGTNVPRFAVIFDQEFVELVPTEDHDLKMHGVVSPSAIRHLKLQ